MTTIQLNANKKLIIADGLDVQITDDEITVTQKAPWGANPPRMALYGNSQQCAVVGGHLKIADPPAIPMFTNNGVPLDSYRMPLNSFVPQSTFIQRPGDLMEDQSALAQRGKLDD